MKILLEFLICFIVVYLVYLFLIILRKNKIDKYKKSSEVKFLVSKYKLDLKKISLKKLAHILALANSFIISLAFISTGIFDNIILKLLLGFLVLLPTMLLVYHIIGTNLNKKCGKK